MNIQSITYANSENTQIHVEGDIVFDSPWPCQSWHREKIKNWLNAGNKIVAFAPDPLLTETQKINQKIEHNEVVAALADELGISKTKLRARIKANRLAKI